MQSNLSRPRILESDRLFLSPPTLDDLETNFEWENDKELCLLDGGSFKPRSYTEVKSRLEKRIEHDSNRYFSIILKTNGDHIGNTAVFDISDHHRRCRWGIRLGREHHRRGYGRETALLIFCYVFEQLKMRRLVSDTHSGNRASIIFQENLGFVLEGRLRQHRLVEGKYVDELLYGMLRADYDRLYHK